MGSRFLLIAGRRPALRLALLLAGAALGILAAWLLGHTMQLRTGRSGLFAYADRLSRISEEFAREDDRTIGDIAHDDLPFCSDDDLAYMRDYAFHSQHVRDIGRTRNGLLYCTTGVGRLSTPIHMPQPSFISGTRRLYISARVILGKQTRGLILEDDGVSLVFNPGDINAYDAPPMHYGVFLQDQFNHRLPQTNGPSIPLTSSEILDGQPIQRAGIFYLPICSSAAGVCNVAFEARADMLRQHTSLVTLTMVLGAVLGGALAAILVLFAMRQRAPEHQLLRAIDREQLGVVYQPIVDLANGRIVGAEALARWINEDGESVRPDLFIALAESRGFITRITRLVLRRTLSELSGRLARGDLRITINISTQDLEDPALVPLLHRSTRMDRLDSHVIGLELTERSIASRASAIAAISRLRQAGHMLYIDDFGTGYSSLAYLHQLDIDAIKIDRAFTQTVGTQAVTASVVPQILEMAAQLNLLVVVEGVETAAQAAYFRAAATRIPLRIFGQGWHLGRPVDAAEFLRLVRVPAPADQLAS